MQPTRTARSLALATILALAFGGLVACGSGNTKNGSASGSTPSVNSDGTTPSEASSSSTPVDPCKAVTADQISTIVGGTVTAEEVPGGGCRFPQGNLRAPAVALAVVPSTSTNGDLEGAVSGIQATMKGAQPEELAGVGDQAYVLIGKSLGGTNLQGAGLIRLGSTVVQVTLTQGTGLSKDEVRSMLIDTITLVAKKN